jgi:hypothetical protein
MSPGGLPAIAFTHLYGEITLTLAAELALHHRPASLAAQPVDQTCQRAEISHPERAPADRRHDERIRPGRIRPAHRQRMLHALIIEEEHPIFRPVLPHTNQQELLAMPGMERMGNPDSTLPSVGIRSI